MRFKLRMESKNEAHVTFRLFVNGGSAGLLTLARDEGDEFYKIVRRGSAFEGHDFSFESKEPWNEPPE